MNCSIYHVGDVITLRKEFWIPEFFDAPGVLNNIKKLADTRLTIRRVHQNGNNFLLSVAENGYLIDSRWIDKLFVGGSDATIYHPNEYLQKSLQNSMTTEQKKAQEEKAEEEMKKAKAEKERKEAEKKAKEEEQARQDAKDLEEAKKLWDLSYTLLGE